MLQIGICDDSLESRFAILVSLEKILEERNIEYNIYEFSHGEGFLKWYIKNAGKIDLLFLDIEMAEMDGMEVAKKIREKNTNIQLVFVTNFPNYVFDGYTVDALGYIMKPAKKEQLNEIITRAITNLYKKSEEIYIIQNKDGMYKIPMDNILYFYSEKRQVYCVTSDNKYGFYSKLDEVVENINDDFVRIHQRYLINSKHIDLIKTEFVYINDEALPVSRSYQKEIIPILTRKIIE